MQLDRGCCSCDNSLEAFIQTCKTVGFVELSTAMSEKLIPRCSVIGPGNEAWGGGGGGGGIICMFQSTA